MPTDGNLSPSPRKVRRNKGRLTGQKRPLKPKDVWAVRVRLQLQRRKRDLALFNLAIDSKLRGCDLVRLRLNDVCVGGHWLPSREPRIGQYLFPSRLREQPH